MADIFLSYARANRDRAQAVAAAMEGDGRSLWWDKRLASGGDYASVIEQEIAAARCVVVGWSAAARDSLWVRAEANEALDQGKIVQINFDGAKPPLPFTMLHFLDFSAWGGAREQTPWPVLKGEIDGAIDGKTEEAQRRPDPGGVPLVIERAPALQGFGKIAVLGWAALGVAIVLALAVLMVVRRLITAETFGWLSIGAAALAVLLLAASAVILLRISAMSKR
jgi:hypothetical protein